MADKDIGVPTNCGDLIDHHQFNIMREKHFKYIEAMDRLNGCLFECAGRYSRGLTLPLDSFFRGDAVLMNMIYATINNDGYLCRMLHDRIEVLFEGTEFSAVFDDSRQ